MADASKSKIVAFPGTENSAPQRSWGNGSIDMNSDLVEEAQKVIPEPPLLINVVSRRVKQLNLGRTPLVETNHRMGTADIALCEIIQGKITAEDVEES